MIQKVWLYVFQHIWQRSKRTRRGLIGWYWSRGYCRSV